MIDFWLVYHKLKKSIAKCLQLPCAESMDWRLSSLVLNLFGNFPAIVLNLVMTENLTKLRLSFLTVLGQDFGSWAIIQERGYLYGDLIDVKPG